MITAVASMLTSICLRHVSHHRAAVSPPEVPLKHPVVEPDPLVIAAQTCRCKPDVRLLLGTVGGQNCTSRTGEALQVLWWMERVHFILVGNRDGGTACVKRCQLWSTVESLFKRLCLISPTLFTRVDYRLDAIQTCCSVKIHWPLKQLEVRFYEQNRFKQANALCWRFINGRKKICWLLKQQLRENFGIMRLDIWNKKERSTPFWFVNKCVNKYLTLARFYNMLIFEQYEH